MSKSGDLFAPLARALGARLVKPQLPRRLQLVITLAAVTSVALLGLVDYAIRLHDAASIDVLYLVSPVVATVLVSANVGFFIALACTAVWVWADSVDPPIPSIATSFWDGVVRALILTCLVVLVSALEDAARRARRSEEGARQFLSYAAHQVRTPLAGIQASSEALILSGLSKDQERLLSVLASEAGRAGRLTASMLQMARLDQREPYPASDVDVAGLCAGEVDRLNGRRPGVEVRFSATPPELPKVVVSPDALREALANVLDNASRHAESRIDVELRMVDDRELTIAVRDDGVGLPPGAEERVFDRFVSFDGANGVGLGLAIARSLIETQHGQLAYRDRSFVIRLRIGSQKLRNRTPR